MSLSNKPSHSFINLCLQSGEAFESEFARNYENVKQREYLCPSTLPVPLHIQCLFAVPNHREVILKTIYMAIKQNICCANSAYNLVEVKAK